MADSRDIDRRHDTALASIAKAVGVEPASLIGEAPGDPALARAITMENIATAVKDYTKSNKAADKTGEAKSNA